MSLIEQKDKAIQLARAIVTNVLVLHEDQVCSSIQKDTFYEEMKEILASARGLFEARVSLSLQKSALFDSAIVDVLLCCQRENKSYEIEEL